MRIEQYLAAYERYKKAFAAMQKLKNEFGKSELITYDFFGNDKQNIVKYAATEEFEKEYRRRERIITHATARLQAAISRIGDTSLSNYLICKYLYGLKNIEIAAAFCYCERHIYRISCLAKKRLYEQLLKLMPKPRRGMKHKTYRYASCREKKVS